MKFVFAIIFIISTFVLTFGQNEQTPVAEKEFGYKDWTYKNLMGDGETNLRQFAKGKKLVMVVYWAPWCPNWKHDVAFVQELHQKYAKDGLAVLGVGEYDTVDKLKQNYEQNKLTFPAVYEQVTSSGRLTSLHYSQRTAAGTREVGFAVVCVFGAVKAAGRRRCTCYAGEMLLTGVDPRGRRKVHSWETRAGSSGALARRDRKRSKCV
jgi:thiol-disulfide isomerase/thioredoxin